MRKKQKLYYVVNARIPTEKAHGVQIMKTCEAFASLGMEIELLVPKRHNSIKINPFDYYGYGLKKNFHIRYLPTVDLIRFNIPFSFKLLSLIFGISVALFLFGKEKPLIYTRGEVVIPLYYLLPGKPKIFFESHLETKSSRYYRKIFSRLNGIIVLTNFHKEEFISKYKLSSEKILVSPDGVDINLFNIDISKKEARKKLNLPINKKLVVYTGSDLSWKGVKTLQKSSNYLDDNIQIVLVGNIEKRECKSCLYVGLKNYKEIPYWLKAADVLVLTGTKEDKISSHYTSPLKMFEYMASGRPIVASNLSSFREILNSKNSVLIQADNPKEMAKGINSLLLDNELSKKISKNALSNVLGYSWQVRSKSILNFCNEKSKN